MRTIVMARAGRPGFKITGGANVSAAPASPCAIEDVARPIQDDGIGDSITVEISQKGRIGEADAAGRHGLECAVTLCPAAPRSRCRGC